MLFYTQLCKAKIQLCLSLKINVDPSLFRCNNNKCTKTGQITHGQVWFCIAFFIVIPRFSYYESKGYPSPVTYASWMIYGVPVAVLVFILQWMWLMVLYRPKKWDSAGPWDCMWFWLGYLAVSFKVETLKSYDTCKLTSCWNFMLYIEKYWNLQPSIEHVREIKLTSCSYVVRKIMQFTTLH